MHATRTLAAAALLALLPACATAPGSNASDLNDQFERTPADVAAIRTYWMGARPPCTMQQIRDVQAMSENGLRWAAWNAGAKAVIGVRTRSLETTPQPGSAPRRLYEGVAVRFPDGCPEAGDTLRAPARADSTRPASPGG
jgi:hypothetical protein